MRDYQSGLSAVGVQNILPSTRWMSVRFAKKNHLAHATIHLRDGTTAVRIGEANKPSKVIVLLHGGGYMAGALPEHIAYTFRPSKTPLKGVAMYVLQYGMSLSLSSSKRVHLPTHNTRTY